jgi:hypothetical protein
MKEEKSRSLTGRDAERPAAEAPAAPTPPAAVPAAAA